MPPNQSLYSREEPRYPMEEAVTRGVACDTAVPECVRLGKEFQSMLPLRICSSSLASIQTHFVTVRAESYALNFRIPYR